MKYDVIVIGGSFAGLSSAYFLSNGGLRVCVFDKGKIGARTKSTGILLESVFNDLKIPDYLIENEIRGAFVFSPNLKKYSLQLKKTKLRQSKTLEFIKWLKEVCMSNGVKFFENQACEKISINQQYAACQGMEGEIIVFATGILPKLNFLPKNNFEYFAGIEYIANLSEIEDQNFVQGYIDLNISPGYGFWVAPIDLKTAHIGLIKEMRDKVPPVTAIKTFISKVGFKMTNIKEIRAGVVPARGTIEKTYGNRFVIVGDAAGQLGQISFGGIHNAVRASKILGEVIPDLINHPTESNLQIYETKWKRELGTSLKTERMFRYLFDKVKSNETVEKLMNVFDVVDRTLFDDTLDNYSRTLRSSFSKLALSYFFKSKIS